MLAPDQPILLSDNLSVYLRYHFLLPGKLRLHIPVGVAEHLVGIVYPLVKAAFHGYHLIQNYLIAFSYRFGYDPLYGPGKQFNTAIQIVLFLRHEFLLFLVGQDTG